MILSFFRTFHSHRDRVRARQSRHVPSGAWSLLLPCCTHSLLQHDVLWPTLSVRDHLRIFAGLKGVPMSNISQEVDATIRGNFWTALNTNDPCFHPEFGLVAKADSAAGTMSGGQKRKLSTAIAFLGK